MEKNLTGNESVRLIISQDTMKAIQALSYHLDLSPCEVVSELAASSLQAEGLSLDQLE
jgi:hypothetical protein